MTEQAWFDEAQKIACDFVQNDQDLGELMLDHCAWYWEECFEEGLTPQQALNDFIDRLSTTPDILRQFKEWRRQK
jgi:hypothetical protein